jgi:hypothetical protein
MTTTPQQLLARARETLREFIDYGYSREKAVALLAELDASADKPEGSAQAVACKHDGRILRGYKNNGDIAWCDKCGQITWAGDGLIPDSCANRDDHAEWANKKLTAWSCASEADGEKRCANWCGHSYCTVSYLDGFMLAAAPQPPLETLRVSENGVG